MGRAGLSWSTTELAARAGVGANTVNRFEAGQDARMSSVAKMRAAFEAAGVVFLAEDGEGTGVRLRKGMEPQPVAAASSAEIKSGADAARGHASGVLDRAMDEIDATGEEKAERVERLTAVPEVVKVARRKSKEASR
jgi:transcriptional regulator with XRE-family HTH domain